MHRRGRRAIEEATQRLTRAMDRADAELDRTPRGRREQRGVRDPPSGRRDRPDEGVHKLGRTAEHDYDR